MRRYKNSRCKTKSNRLKDGTHENLAAAPSVRLSSALTYMERFLFQASFSNESLQKEALNWLCSVNRIINHLLPE